MGIAFEQRPACPLCECGDATTLCELKFRERPLATFIEEFYRGRVPLASFGDTPYRVRECLRCGFIYQDPILSADGMRELYQNWVDAESSLEKKRRAGHRRYRQYAAQMQTLAQLFRERPPGEIRVLDYGMGWGYWCRMAQAHGFDVSGYELSAERCAHARAMGVNVIEQLPEGGASYDFIFANQVFEHLPEPRQSLRELVENLAPGGVVYLRVPDGRGAANWLRQRDWSAALDSIHPLEHINCFTRKTLLELGKSAGLAAFDPPLRLNWGSLWGGLRREIKDRLLTTHVFFRRR